MTRDYELATCGLSCDLCDANTTKLQDAAKYLHKAFEDPMFQSIFLMINPELDQENFLGFMSTLAILNKFPPCTGCQGRKNCVIDQCAKQKNKKSCSDCKLFDLESGICREIPNQSENTMQPPAPIYFQGLSKRYKKWNVENLILLNKGQKDKVNSRIDKLIKEGKSSRDLLDITVNLFESMK
ncbi:MAG: DUF3795 domain-containing protein [Promethearchaeota archaeon]